MREGNDQLLVISHELWQSAFDGSEAVIGRAVHLNERPCTIIGVMPEEFAPNGLFRTYGVDAWMPKAFESPAVFRDENAH